MGWPAGILVAALMRSQRVPPCLTGNHLRAYELGSTRGAVALPMTGDPAGVEVGWVSPRGAEATDTACCVLAELAGSTATVDDTGLTGLPAGRGRGSGLCVLVATGIVGAV